MGNTVSVIEIFDNINKWLDFSERKNAYIFSFFSLMVVFTPFINKMTDISIVIKYSLSVFYVLYVFSIIFTLLSFFPITNISRYIIEKGRNKKINDDDNLFFWGHICKYSRDEYKKKLNEKYGLDIESKFINDIVEQIIINSNITNNKFVYFKYSVVITVIAFVQFAICMTINIFI